jgi:ribosomal protein S18 acetylase RimI-like enzyme
MSILRESAERGAGATRRLRVGPWRGGGGAAYVVPTGDGRVPLDAAEVTACLRSLARQGITVAYTSALGRWDRQPFLEAGFREVERLHLLAHTVDDRPRRARVRRDDPGAPVPAAAIGERDDHDRRGRVAIRRARRRDRTAVLDVDRAAFDRFWHLDDVGLTEALTATTSVHFRVAVGPAGVEGYTICGRASRRGYVQRLAVHPDHHGRGTGRALLLDGLRWLRRRGVREVVVNTQEGNERSLRLYQGCGFVLQPDMLAVLRADVDPPPEPHDPRRPGST